MSSFTVSLDFEMFWGVLGSVSVSDYKKNVLGVRDAVPSILEVFSEYGVNATWATVGSILFDNFNHWDSFVDSYSFSDVGLHSQKYKNIIRSNEGLFFDKDLVDLIGKHDNQEIATHTFGHFVADPYSTRCLDEFELDMLLGKKAMDQNNICPKSIVFPRNIINNHIVNKLPFFGIGAYRGTQKGVLYSTGDIVPFGVIGKAARYIDSVAMFTKDDSIILKNNKAINISASYFLRPVSGPLSNRLIKSLRMNRIKDHLNFAVDTDSDFHLWWHPHNFGENLNLNIDFLREILDYVSLLRSDYGMKSMNMLQHQLSFE